MTKFIGRLIELKVISSAQGRALELFTYTTIFSLIGGALDNLLSLIQGNGVSWEVFLTTFAMGTVITIQAGLRKYFADKQKELANMK